MAFRDFAKVIRTLVPQDPSNQARTSERLGADYYFVHFNYEGKRYTLSIMPHDLERPVREPEAVATATFTPPRPANT